MADTPETENPDRDPLTGRLLPGHSPTAPSPYRPEYVEQARKLAQLGATDYEIADFFGVSDRTLRRWKHAHPDFCDALKVGKSVADDRVEMSLYKKATGYTFDSEKVFCDKGSIVRANIVEHVPPDTQAATFWLKNRRKEEWKDKVEHEHAGPNGGEIMARVTVENVIKAVQKLDDDC